MLGLPLTLCGYEKDQEMQSGQGFRQALIIPGQPPKPGNPAKAALYDPAPGQKHMPCVCRNPSYNRFEAPGLQPAETVEALAQVVLALRGFYVHQSQIRYDKALLIIRYITGIRFTCHHAPLNLFRSKKFITCSYPIANKIIAYCGILPTTCVHGNVPVLRVAMTFK